VVYSVSMPALIYDRDNSTVALGFGTMGLSWWCCGLLVAKIFLALAQPMLLIRYGQHIQVLGRRARIVYPFSQ
jgi:hypothetical protein